MIPAVLSKPFRFISGARAFIVASSALMVKTIVFLVLSDSFFVFAHNKIIYGLFYFVVWLCLILLSQSPLLLQVPARGRKRDR